MWFCVNYCRFRALTSLQRESGGNIENIRNQDVQFNLWRFLHMSHFYSSHCGTSTGHELVGAMAQWHDILHEWNMRVDHWSRASGISSWSKCMIQNWNFASYIHWNLPAEQGWREHLRGNRFQDIPPVDAPNKLGTLNWKRSAVPSFGQFGNCCEKCGPVGCSASVFPRFPFHVNVSSMSLEGRLQVAQFVVSILFFRLLPYIGLACGRWGCFDLTCYQHWRCSRRL